jgi:hypothetical protein
MPSWLTSDRFLIIGSIVSVLMFVGTIVALPVIAARLPEDYFIAPIPRRAPWKVVVRSVAAAVLILMGLAMLVLPGQGTLTILLGVSLLDFPAKRRLERRILANQHVLRALNAVRRRAGRPPLLAP